MQAPDKLWFIVLVASIILFQCITSDIYVFNHDKSPAPTTPRATVTPATIKPTINGTIKPTNQSLTTKKVDQASKHQQNKVMFAKLPPRKKILEKNK